MIENDISSTKMATDFAQCFNPFELELHSIRNRKSLRTVTRAQSQKLKSDDTLVGLLICDSCRLKISKSTEYSTTAEQTSSTEFVNVTSPMKSDNPVKTLSSSSLDGILHLPEDNSLETERTKELSGIQSVNIPTASSISSLDDIQSLPEDDLVSVECQLTSGSSPEILETDVALTALNRSLCLLGESPIRKRKLPQQLYPVKKFEQVSDVLGKKVFGVNIPEQTEERDKNSGIIQQLKEKFHATDDNNLKISILTLFTDWTVTEIQSHFKASKHMIAVAKKVKEEKGILSFPNAKAGKRLADAIIEDIVNFYESDVISRMMPGKKDFVTIFENGSKTQKQKRLVLCNLKEAYSEFKQQFPDKKHCSFSKFAELRPKHCVLAGASGTHTVCVCTIHQNVKLMLDGGKIVNKISKEISKPIKTYRDCLQQIICDPSSADCYLRQCKQCPGTTDLINSLQSAYDEQMIDTIVYRQWVTVDRASLETLQSSVPEFLEKLSSMLLKLLPHNFIAEQQSDFLNKKKENLANDECIVTGDFSENYSFVFQDAIQGVHWNNDQATIHPFVIYYREKSALKHKSFAVISDCLKHDTVAVHLFQGKIIEIIKKMISGVKKLIYFTDGAAGQYKNKKNFINLSHHHDDFGIAAEWHFFATSHGKGPCDGIGGTIKRLAARASLQRPDQSIKNPKTLFDWAKINIPSVEFIYVDTNEYRDHQKKLESRFELAKTINGTQKSHSFVPINKKQIEMREFSLASKHSVVNVMK